MGNGGGLPNGGNNVPDISGLMPDGAGNGNGAGNGPATPTAGTEGEEGEEEGGAPGGGPPADSPAANAPGQGGQGAPPADTPAAAASGGAAGGAAAAGRPDIPVTKINLKLGGTPAQRVGGMWLAGGGEGEGEACLPCLLCLLACFPCVGAHTHTAVPELTDATDPNILHTLPIIKYTTDQDPHRHHQLPQGAPRPECRRSVHSHFARSLHSFMPTTYL